MHKSNMNENIIFKGDFKLRDQALLYHEFIVVDRECVCALRGDDVTLPGEFEQ